MIDDIKEFENNLQQQLSSYVLENVQPKIDNICKKYNLRYVSGMGHYSFADPKGIDFNKNEPRYLLDNFNQLCEEIKDEPEYFGYTLEHFINMKPCLIELAELWEILDESIMDKLICWYTYDSNKDCVLEVYPNAYGEVCRKQSEERRIIK